ncbi:hypothetical protein AX774_g751 [Zancudomyces culisetae]|uniref:Uncharacterized protein n=1 Tax=Zancudomyces culisetae TaxID=1213189 RepID=A0A1R1PXK9_ZANCU|nr:hypothetical protein AX774_g751 [Zancudomyces culisetae]|eukprot:OMH85700.1 hypothetical protein AX774_g751 [Zancudomyces culisetae]
MGCIPRLNAMRSVQVYWYTWGTKAGWNHSFRAAAVELSGGTGFSNIGGSILNWGLCCGGAYTQNVQKPVGGAYRYNGEITADPDIYAPVNVNPGVTGQPGINPIPTQGIGIPGGPGYNAGVGVGVGAGAGAGNYDAKGYYINENYANQVPPSVPSSTTSDFYFVKIKYIFAVGGFGDNEGDLDPDFKPLIDAQKSALNMYSSVLTAIPTLPPLPPPPKLGAYINKNPGFPGDNSANGGGNVNYNNMVY